MDTHSPTPHTAMCETHPGDPTVRREAMLPWNVLAVFSSRFAVKLRTTELLQASSMRILRPVDAFKAPDMGIRQVIGSLPRTIF